MSSEISVGHVSMGRLYGSGECKRCGAAVEIRGVLPPQALAYAPLIKGMEIRLTVVAELICESCISTVDVKVSRN